MPRMKKNYAEIIRMAENYGISDNALFVSAAKQYQTQVDVIARIKREIDTGEDPEAMIKELPKHTDSATRTLNSMVDIIRTLGRPKEEKKDGKLEAFL